MNNPITMIQQFNQFRSTFTGNAQQRVQQMLNSGQISQAQYDAAVQQAKQLQNMLFGQNSPK